ncbi:hypothetical protein POM88_040127 [Heracleum sosnowskyi]|uniref:Uncharacterized protein n=1 Tax=Heracleum sosnowskyi TaxID=360622 RepID=A0AAD8HCL5_9APIA|nr:hypothetical protein POM88_040127 [Heracleum sosnowskyi]
MIPSTSLCPSVSVVRVGNYTTPGFHQGAEMETERNIFVVIANRISWQQLSKNSSSPSSADVVNFRVDLSTAVRFRDNLSKVKSKTRRIMAWANVEVDRVSGKKTSKKDIKLKHMIMFRLISSFICF